MGVINGRGAILFYNALGSLFMKCLIMIKMLNYIGIYPYPHKLSILFRINNKS